MDETPVKATTPSRRKPGDTWPALALFLILAVLYLLTRTYALTSDALGLAMNAESQTVRAWGFWTPRHFLWPAYGVAVYRGALALGLHGRSLVPLQIQNALVEAICAALVYLLLRRAGAGRRLAWSLSLLLGVSYFFWNFGTEVKFYPVTMLAIILSWLFLAPPNSTPGPSPVRDRPQVWVAGIWAGIGVLLGLVNVLFIPSALAALAGDKGRSWKVRILEAGRFLAGAGLAWMVPVAYVGVRYNGFGLSGLANWFLEVRNTVGYDVSSPWANLALFLQRCGDLLTGFGYGSFYTGPLMLLSTNFFRLALLGLAVLILLRLRVLIRSRGFYFWGGLGTLIFYGLGMALIDPYNDFRYFLLVPLLVLAGTAGGILEREGRRWPGPLVLVLALALFGLNWMPFHAVSVRSRSQGPSDLRMGKIQNYAYYIKPGVSVVALGLSPDSKYYSYFLKADTIDLVGEYQLWGDPRRALLSVRQRVNTRLRAHQQVFLDSQVLDTTAAYPTWAPPYMKADEIVNFINLNYRLVPVCRSESGETLYRLELRK